MGSNQKVIVLAGVGNLGKYVCEKLLSGSQWSLVVISRQTRDWFKQREIDVRITDYTESSILSILDAVHASALISFYNAADASFLGVHCAMLNACMASQSCQRFIPSEFIGNIEDFPLYPGIYGDTRAPFRQILQASKGIEWTLFQNGWLMDYYLTRDKTYMPPIPDEFPIDPNGWKACIRGTGEEPQSWTSCRDIAAAIVALLAAPEWEPVTYVCGQWGSFNEMIPIVEQFYGKPLPTTHRSKKEIQGNLRAREAAGDQDSLILAQVDEWMVAGASECPRAKTLQHRERYFPELHFMTLRELLESSKCREMF
ncbi:hypothetical protein FE257_010763 [Aspergillus nanangensis]|uniref:RCK N-terminal domain-containing protein n=1 Tax=Aspergillus nanangensis TaxID=2582783 RepID=A0AAD4CVS9_ASPNN|nr:hypothetical protein FE257_010763 [Aspergillus nanangensis]